MQEYEVKVTVYAESALREIGNYICQELKAPQAAINTLKTISDGIKRSIVCLLAFILHWKNRGEAMA